MDVFDDKCLDGIREAVDGSTMARPIDGISGGVGPSAFLSNIFTDWA